MICRQCGAELPEDAKFCGVCGHNLQSADREPEPDTIQTAIEVSDDKAGSTQVPDTEHKVSSSRRSLVAVAIGLVVLIVFAYAVMQGFVNDSIAAANEGVTSNDLLAGADLTREDVRNYISEWGLDKVSDFEPTYDDHGLLDDRSDYLYLDVLNLYRYVSGVPAVGLKGDFVEYDLQNVVDSYKYGGYQEHVLTERPPEMTDADWESAKYAAHHSSVGSVTVHCNDIWTCIKEWVCELGNDTKNENATEVGHRRSLLSTALGDTALYLDGKFLVAWGGDKNENVEDDIVVWPTPEMPTELFVPGSPWSISLDYVQNPATVSVTVTRESDGRVWDMDDFDNFNVSDNKYYDKSAIVFTPRDLYVEPYKGEKFDVHVEGLLTGDLDYTVDMFRAGNLHPMHDFNE